MRRVLIVDDSLFTRRSLQQILNQGEYSVVAEASNGLEALVKYKQFKPDFVTMDITMPLQNGIDAVRSIISIDPNAKIIMVSAVDQKNLVFEAIQAGASHYILKPFNADIIMSVIEKVFQSEDQKENKIKKKEPEPQKSAPTSSEKKASVPLSVENRNSFIIVNIPSDLNATNFHSLREIINTFLIIKPLKLILNFGDMDSLESIVLQKLVLLLEKISDADGKVVFFSRSRPFLKLLMDNNLEVLMSHYTGPLDVSEIEI